jgi:hypothetical protein
MLRGKTAIAGLRFISGVVMSAGLIAAVYGFMQHATVPLFAFDVPAWVIGVSAAYMGLRYWRRIPALEEKIDPNANFKWSNFSFRKGP